MRINAHFDVTRTYTCLLQVRMTFRAEDSEYMALPDRVPNQGGAQTRSLGASIPSSSNSAASSSMNLSLTKPNPKMTFRTEDAACRALEKAAVK